MRVTIEFAHTQNDWVGKLIRAGTQRFEFTTSIEKTKKAQPRPDASSDPHGLKSAETAYYRRELSSVFRNWPRGVVKTAQEFERVFLDMVKSYILDQAAHYGRILIPTNYQEQIWTADHMGAMAKRLKRKPGAARYARLRWVESLLLSRWKSSGLCNMDRRELCAWVNEVSSSFPGKPFSPNAVWQIAYRLGVFSGRERGPKPKPQTNTDPGL
jgi:hypothetical protein